jgi:hypothetical protein
MKTGTERTCDICGSVIPPRTEFRQVQLAPGAASVFVNLKDPELEPNWRITKDGTGRVELDICGECSARMNTTTLWLPAFGCAWLARSQRQDHTRCGRGWCGFNPFDHKSWRYWSKSASLDRVLFPSESPYPRGHEWRYRRWRSPS